MDNSRNGPTFLILILSSSVIIQGETEEEMQSWIHAIASVSPRGRSASEPVCLITNQPASRLVLESKRSPT